ncbi:YndM family protein [Virgibacillus xinjiangensis]|uniref:YndM family protein n=1 Tax=Virgibacillus xinjiangensis TaxID=393090 RepID=A0ABV7CQL3_9BACI
MRHIWALLIKFLITATVLFSILTIFEAASLGEILWMSLLITGAAYLIGDLFILPRYGNTIASIADFGLCAVAVWLLSMIFVDQGFPVFTAALFIGFFIAISEALFHIYMQEKVLIDDDEQEKGQGIRREQLQTEFAEEHRHDEKEKK